jgi:putative ABC transport system permease protein
MAGLWRGRTSLNSSQGVEPWGPRSVMLLRHALRSLLKRPGLLISVVLTVAIGIGANVTMFSFLRHVLLSPLPFRDADRLVQIWQTNPILGHVPVSYPDFIHWRASAAAFHGMSAYTFQAMNKVSLVGEGQPEQIQATIASHDLLPSLGSSMILGRNFSALDESHRQRVAVLSESLWRRKFSADPNIIGRSIRLAP